MPHPVPDIPGALLTDPQIAGHLSARVAELCGLRNSKFPGAQPVSFTGQSLEMLETMDFWVCEKSDGVRVLVFIVMNGMTMNQEVWLVGRSHFHRQR
jgi:mRNA guanylyltransferase